MGKDGNTQSTISITPAKLTNNGFVPDANSK
jgi:hypothetical protein